MTKKTTRVKKTDLSVTILLILGILVVANFFSYKLFLRLDLTENKIFSISDATRNTMRELDDVVNIKAYFSSTLPSQVLSLKQEVGDVLDEYEAYSGGKVKVEFIDPSDDVDLAQELAIKGIPQLTFEVYEKDKMQLVNGYMGIAISYSDNIEVIPAVKRDTSDLEYQITSAIKKVTVDEMATIGYLSSHGTHSLTESLKAADQGLRELYSVREVSLSEEEPSIVEDIDTLLIVGAKEKFSGDQLRAINAFVVRGGALLILQDGVSIGQGLMAQKNNTGLDTLLKQYGISLNHDLIADKRSGVASFTQGFLTFSSDYPFWPKITNAGFNPDASAVSNLENVILPWASSVVVDTAKISEDSFKYLAFTTNDGWRVSDNFNISPNGSAVPQGEQKRYNLALVVNGTITNAYPEEGAAEKINGKIVVVGDSDFVTDGFLRNNPDNLTLFQNLVDTLSFDEDLISIRSKGVTSRPVKELSDGSRATIRYLNIFGLTLLVIALGMLRYFMRRKSRFVDDI
ncbi:GldG family protein [Candidatus Parcubacteria bacterium]|nr:GldG family protein [Candidatus Parcubacteria bacterium]